MFEWDFEKSKKNKKKHGVSFEEAAEVWQGTYLELTNIAYTKDGEFRNAAVGLIKDQIYTVIWANRRGAIRIISARKARNGEKKAYFESL